MGPWNLDILDFVNEYLHDNPSLVSDEVKKIEKLISKDPRLSIYFDRFQTMMESDTQVMLSKYSLNRLLIQRGNDGV